MNNHEDLIPFSRRNIFGGKRTAKLEGRVSEELKEIVRRTWHDAGFESESEWLEMVTAIACLGAEHVRMLQEQRVRRVCFVSDMPQTTVQQRTSMREGGPEA